MGTSQRTFNEENMMTATAIATADTPQASNPMAIIQVALQNGAEPAQLEKLMELQERWERNRAAEAFSGAMTDFQRQCKFVGKVRDAKIVSKNGGSYGYKFASFDDVMRVAAPVLDDCRLAVSFRTEAIEKGIRVTCRLRHGIHFEDHTLDVPIPAMNVNDTQRYGAALSYAKRYALCAALNIVCTDDTDDDGASCIDPITMEQEIEIAELIEAKGADKAKFLKWMGVEKITDIPANNFTKAVTALRSKK